MINSIKSLSIGRLLLSITFLSATALNAQTTELKYPETKKVEQEDNYFGTVVKDPYRWLENDTSKEVADWVTRQNALTNSYLDKIPFRASLYAHLKSILSYEKYSAPFKAGKYIVFNKNNGLQNQSVTYIERDGNEIELLDPNKISKDGTSAINILGVSSDKQYMAYAVNESGSDWQRIEVINILKQQKTNDVLSWVKFSGVAWQGNGFYYSRYADQEEAARLTAKNENHQIYYHQLGAEQNSDRLVYQDKMNVLRINAAQVSEDEKYLFIYIYEGAHENQILYRDLTEPESEFKILFKGFENQYSIIDNRGSQILVLTNFDAKNNQIISLDLAKFNPEKSLKSQMKVVVKENKSLLESANAVGGKLFLNYLQDVSNHVYQYTFEGVLENEISMPGPGTVTGFTGYKEDSEVFYTFTSFTYPATIYRYDIATKKSTVFKKSAVAFNPEDYTTEQVFYSSKDGTKIPMFLTYKKGLVKDGTNPTLLYGYGGFDINMTPYFSASRILLLENGGIYAVANIRGGGEYGEDWHKNGMLDKKQNVFNDFIAAAEYIIKNKYTSSEKLACQGGSNGGLLIGAVINQRPNLFKVSFPDVGVMDMLRYQKFTIGWGWVPEYGSSDKESDFKTLYAYSPLHNIKDNKYPATMITTADHDDRVVPAHSFKYTATLQEHQKGPAPILIRIDVNAGHGDGKPLDKLMSEITDIYSFMFYNMGITPKTSAK